MKELIDELNKICLDTERFEYKVSQWSGSIEMYGSDDELTIPAHLEHAITNEKEDGGWSIMASCCRIDRKTVIGTFLFFRRKKN